MQPRKTLCNGRSSAAANQSQRGTICCMSYRVRPIRALAFYTSAGVRHRRCSLLRTVDRLSTCAGTCRHCQLSTYPLPLWQTHAAEGRHLLRAGRALVCELFIGTRRGVCEMQLWLALTSARIPLRRLVQSAKLSCPRSGLHAFAKDSPSFFVTQCSGSHATWESCRGLIESAKQGVAKISKDTVRCPNAALPPQ